MIMIEKDHETRERVVCDYIAGMSGPALPSTNFEELFVPKAWKGMRRWRIWMYYPDDVIEEVRTRNDIVDVISRYVNLKQKGANYFGLCPFHNEKSPSFSVSPGKQMYYCFGCGAGGNVITFVMEYENYSFVEAVKISGRPGWDRPCRRWSIPRRPEAQADLKNHAPGDQPPGSETIFITS